MNTNFERDYLAELSTDLEAIESMLLVAYESLIDGSTTAVGAQAAALDGIRRYLTRIITELDAVDNNYNLVKRDKSET